MRSGSSTVASPITFSAQQKLIERPREGAKIIKRYDTAKTPLGRTIEAGVCSQKDRLASKDHRRDPTRDLSRRITAPRAELERLAITKQPTPIRKVNRAFVNSDRPEVSRRAASSSSRAF